jgi:glycerophosphoryl diester phosphodiesterase
MAGASAFRFDLQGHRGARGLLPENTLPSFEAALDASVSSIETDLHLSRDGVPVLFHDAQLDAPPCALLRAEAPDPADRPLVASLTLAQLRCYRAADNPAPSWFPAQRPLETPLAQLYARQQDIDPYSIPTLEDLYRFVAAYSGPLGEQAGKSAEQRRRARRLRFDLELKRVPFLPEVMGDGYDGRGPGLLEQRVVQIVQAAEAVEATTVRSFDHRCLLHLHRLEPRLGIAVLMAETSPLAPADLARRAGASLYCPCYLYLDREAVESLREAGRGVLPWTVNEPAHWERLLSWGVTGITTDYPDALARFLLERGVEF